MTTEEVNKWLDDTRKLFLDEESLERYIGSPETCPPTLYRILSGGNAREKRINLIDYFNSLDDEPMIEEKAIVEKDNLKVLIADGSESKEIIDFLSERFEVEVFVEDENVSKSKLSVAKVVPDLVIFTGGEDINPDFYGDSVGDYTTDINKDRDNLENLIYHRYRYVPKLGIGRGAQFLTVMKGGTVIQHVTGHDKSHRITTADGNFDIESNHHQMMFPYIMNKDSYEILAWSKLFRSSVYLNGRNEQMDLPREFLEVEIIKFDKSCLCIQPHPELSENTSFKRKCLRYIADFLNKDSYKKKVQKEDNYEFTLKANSNTSRIERAPTVRYDDTAPTWTKFGSKDVKSSPKFGAFTTIQQENGRWFSITRDANTHLELARTEVIPPQGVEIKLP